MRVWWVGGGLGGVRCYRWGRTFRVCGGVRFVGWGSFFSACRDRVSFSRVLCGAVVVSRRRWSQQFISYTRARWLPGCTAASFCTVVGILVWAVSWFRPCSRARGIAWRWVRGCAWVKKARNSFRVEAGRCCLAACSLREVSQLVALVAAGRRQGAVSIAGWFARNSWVTWGTTANCKWWAFAPAATLSHTPSSVSQSSPSPPPTPRPPTWSPDHHGATRQLWRNWPHHKSSSS